MHWPTVRRTELGSSRTKYVAALEASAPGISGPYFCALFVEKHISDVHDTLYESAKANGLPTDHRDHADGD